ncbi:hypothetical protein DFJ77DRAFT_440659 [Powellomyces hirtus]|nr:hypothetical protein DFJ77DRAFT_440659 [Powellomyces hirtus]
MKMKGPTGPTIDNLGASSGTWRRENGRSCGPNNLGTRSVPLVLLLELFLDCGAMRMKGLAGPTTLAPLPFRSGFSLELFSDCGAMRMKGLAGPTTLAPAQEHGTVRMKGLVGPTTMAPFLTPLLKDEKWCPYFNRAPHHSSIKRLIIPFLLQKKAFLEANAEMHAPVVHILPEMSSEQCCATFSDVNNGLIPLLRGFELVDEGDPPAAVSRIIKHLEYDHPDLHEDWRLRGKLGRVQHRRKKFRQEDVKQRVADVLDGTITATTYRKDGPSASGSGAPGRRPHRRIIIKTPPTAQLAEFKGRYIDTSFGDKLPNSRNLEGLQRIEPSPGTDFWFYDEGGELIGTICYNSNGQKEHDRRLAILRTSCSSRPPVTQGAIRKATGIMVGAGLRRGSSRCVYDKTVLKFTLKHNISASDAKFLVATEHSFAKELLAEASLRHPECASYLLLAADQALAEFEEIVPPMFATEDYVAVCHTDDLDDGLRGEILRATGKPMGMTPPDDLLDPTETKRKLEARWALGYCAAGPEIKGDWVFVYPKEGFYILLEPDCFWTWQSGRFHCTAQLDTSGGPRYTTSITVPSITAAAIRKYGQGEIGEGPARKPGGGRAR